MCDITVLNSNDVVPMVNLLCTAFEKDALYRYAFRSDQSRKRWLPKIHTAIARLTLSYGMATGIRSGDHSRLAASALWFSPDRPFPPPWYWAIGTCYPLIPIVLEYRTYLRYQQLHTISMSLMPKKRRILLLSGLAVQEDHRNLGLGRRLIECGQDYAAEERCAVFLHCWTELCYCRTINAWDSHLNPRHY